MNTRYSKRLWVGFLVCLFLFCACFSMNIAATEGKGEDPAVSTVSEEEPVVSEDPAVSDVTSEEPASQVVSSEPAGSTVSQNDSKPTNPTGNTSSVTSSKSGGNNTVYTSTYQQNGSYVYNGSYAGLASTVEETDENGNPVSPTNKNSNPYETYATVGMICFGLLACACVVGLILFNRKVHLSKKEHPEWYPKKEKAQKEPKNNAPKH